MNGGLNRRHFLGTLPFMAGALGCNRSGKRIRVSGITEDGKLVGRKDLDDREVKKLLNPDLEKYIKPAAAG